MHSDDFGAAEQRMLAGGVQPAHARRIAEELEEHYRSLIEQLRSEGLGKRAAARVARRELGALDLIADMACSEPSLLRWPLRYPLLGAVWLPVVYAAAASTQLEADGSAAAVARWSIILAASATITAGMLLALQLAITLT